MSGASAEAEECDQCQLRAMLLTPEAVWYIYVISWQGIDSCINLLYYQFIEHLSYSSLSAGNISLTSHIESLITPCPILADRYREPSEQPLLPRLHRYPPSIVHWTSSQPTKTYYNSICLVSSTNPTQCTLPLFSKTLLGLLVSELLVSILSPVWTSHWHNIG